jgi:hypothetical protein
MGNFYNVDKMKEIEWKPTSVPFKNQVVGMIGSSYCAHHEQVMIDIGTDYDATVISLCKNGNFGLRSPMNTFDYDKIELLKSRNVTVLVWADIWMQTTEDYDFDSIFQYLSLSFDHVVIVGQPPEVDMPTTGIILRNIARYSFVKYISSKHEHLGKGRLRRVAEARISASCRDIQNVNFFDASHLFMKEEHMRLVDPITGQISHRDTGHVTYAGSYRYSFKFREYIFNHSVQFP